MRARIVEYNSLATSKSKSIEYVIAVEYRGMEWKVYRRFSELRGFRSTLRNACHLASNCNDCLALLRKINQAPFPKRKPFFGSAEEVTARRALQFNQFLDTAFSSPTMENCFYNGCIVGGIFKGFFNVVPTYYDRNDNNQLHTIPELDTTGTLL